MRQEPIPPRPLCLSLCTNSASNTGRKSHNFSLSTLPDDTGRTVERAVVEHFAPCIEQSAGRVNPFCARVALYPSFVVSAGEQKVAKATHAARLFGLLQRVVLRIQVVEITYSLYARTIESGGR